MARTEREHTSPHYKAIGAMIRKSMDQKYGKVWTSVFGRDVASNLVRAEAFNVMQAQQADETVTGADVQAHGWNSYLAALDACGLADD